MSGGGSGGGGGGGTTIQDLPAWQRAYVERLLGKAETNAAQPYQQFQGPQIAGFTQDQLKAFQGIENLPSTYQPTINSAVGSANQGAASANNIYGAGAGNINASTQYNPLAAVSPYLGAATQYDSAAASQPWLNQAAGYQAMAAQAGSPQGIQDYMSPYTNNVVQGIQDQANLNWNQNIMPGVNDKFVGSGQYGSGRNAQVLGQAAGNFQTGLSANVSNALQSGYNMAGNQAAQQAQLLSGLGGQSLTGASTAGNAQTSQINNLLAQGTLAGGAAQQQSSNLLNAGKALGDLTSTQAGQQLQAANTLGNLGNTQQQMGLAQNQALQAVGQQQQQLNQSNLDVAMKNFQDQQNWAKQQTYYLNDMIRGLPQTQATGTTTQNPAYSVSPISALGGTAAAGLSLLGDDKTTQKKRGGIVKGYAEGGMVDEEMTPLDYASQPATPEEPAQSASSLSQQQQLLALARGLLTPVQGGNPFAAVGQGIGNMQDLALKQQALNLSQRRLADNTPATLKIADAIRKARASGDTQMLNDIGIAGKLYDKGLITDANGEFGVAEGYAPAVGDIAGEKSRAQQQAKKDVDLNMNPEIKKEEKLAEGDANRKIAAQEKLDTNADTSELVDELRNLNAKTLDIPYLETAQGTAKAIDSEAATAYDLMKQARLELAAPLAKQLGVNPTDKDFQASLDRIFDFGATKSSRAAQIEALSKRIKSRQDRAEKIAGRLGNNISPEVAPELPVQSIITKLRSENVPEGKINEYLKAKGYK